MHGGIAATLLDSVVGCAVHTTVATAEGRVVDDSDRLIAHATTTCMILQT